MDAAPSKADKTHVDIHEIVQVVLEQVSPKRSQFWEAADRILKILVVVIAPIAAWLVVFFINTVLEGIEKAARLGEDHEKRILVIENTRYTLKDAAAAQLQTLKDSAAIQLQITSMWTEINERPKISDIPPDWFQQRVEDIRTRLKALEDTVKRGG